jgi:prevent-host-death family protein
MSAASRRIPATTAAKNFGTLVDRVRDHGTIFIVERHGRPVAQIGPVDAPPRSTLADLATLFARPSGLPGEYVRAVERFVRQVNKPRVPPNPWER